MKIPKGQTKVNIELVSDLDVENHQVKLQHNAGHYYEVIIVYWLPAQ